MLSKWRERLFKSKTIYDIIVKKGSKVCELHFKQDDVKKTDVMKLGDGTVYVSERIRPKLNPTAIPMYCEHVSPMKSVDKQDKPISVSSTMSRLTSGQNVKNSIKILDVCRII